MVHVLLSECPSQQEHALVGPEVRKKCKADGSVCNNEILDHLDDYVNDLYCDFENAKEIRKH